MDDDCVGQEVQKLSEAVFIALEGASGRLHLERAWNMAGNVVGHSSEPRKRLRVMQVVNIDL
jgi:hypothetical protein